MSILGIVVILIIVWVVWKFNFSRQALLKKRYNTASRELFDLYEETLWQEIGSQDSVDEVLSNNSINARCLGYWMITTIMRETMFLGDLGSHVRGKVYLDHFHDHFHGPNGLIKKLGGSFDDRDNAAKNVNERYLYLNNSGDWKKDFNKMLTSYNEEYDLGEGVTAVSIAKKVLQLPFQENLKRLGLSIPHTMYINDVVSEMKKSS